MWPRRSWNAKGIVTLQKRKELERAFKQIAGGHCKQLSKSMYGEETRIPNLTGMTQKVARKKKKKKKKKGKKAKSKKNSLHPEERWQSRLQAGSCISLERREANSAAELLAI